MSIKSDLSTEASGMTTNVSITEQPFQFTGKASQYFGIWLVNILLTVLTLGVYSAWAKVRTQCFFYGHTFFAGLSFDYLAQPLSILKGWSIAAALFIVFAIINELWPVTVLLFYLCLLIALPWLMNVAWSFRCVNSAYRGLRFRFRKDYRAAAEVYIGLPLLSVLTLGVLLPYMQYRQKQFVFERVAYGQTDFSFTATAKDFYRLYVRTSLIAVLGFLSILAVTVLVNGVTGLFETSSDLAEMPSELVWLGGSQSALFFLGYLCWYAYFKSLMINLVWQHVRIEEHCFISQVNWQRLLSLYITNALGIVLSVGLLIPWARVRMYRYYTQTKRLTIQGSLDGFVAGQQQKESATAQEVGDVFDVDLGL